MNFMSNLRYLANVSERKLCQKFLKDFIRPTNEIQTPNSHSTLTNNALKTDILFSKKAQNKNFLITDIKSRETVSSFKDHEKSQKNR